MPKNTKNQQNINEILTKKNMLKLEKYKFDKNFYFVKIDNDNLAVNGVREENWKFFLWDMFNFSYEKEKVKIFNSKNELFNYLTKQYNDNIL